MTANGGAHDECHSPLPHVGQPASCCRCRRQLLEVLAADENRTVEAGMPHSLLFQQQQHLMLCPGLAVQSSLPLPTELREALVADWACGTFESALHRLQIHLG